MKEGSATTATGLVVGVLGVMAALFVWAVLTDRQIPVISGERESFFVLFIVGFAMCALGPLRDIAPNDWLNPTVLVACALGVAALMLAAAVLIGIGGPLVPSPRTAFVFLSCIMGGKVVLAMLHHAIWNTMT